MARLKFGALTLLSLTLWGQVHGARGEPVCTAAQQGCGHLGFELLLLNPSTAIDAYTIFSPQVAPAATPFGDLKQVDPDYEIGGRVFGSWERCNRWELAAEYTYFDEKHRDQTVAGPNQAIWVVFSHPDITLNEFVGGSAAARTDVNFQEALLDIGRTLHIGSCVRLRLGAGLRYDRFSDQFGVTYLNSNGSERVFSQTRSSIWGIGPAFTASVKYSICKGVYLHARTRGAILTGEQSGRTVIEATTAQAANLGIEPTTEIFGAWDGRLGLGYCCRCGKCWTINVEVGYETVILVEAVKRWRFFNETAEGQGQLDTHDARLNGAYWRVSFGF